MDLPAITVATTQNNFFPLSINILTAIHKFISMTLRKVTTVDGW